MLTCKCNNCKFLHYVNIKFKKWGENMFKLEFRSFPYFMHINIFKTYNYEMVDYKFNYSQIMLVKQGEFEIIINGKPFTAKKGSCVVIPFGSVVSFNCYNKDVEEFKVYSLCFYSINRTFSDIDESITSVPYIITDYCFDAPDYERAKNIFENMIDHYNASNLNLTISSFYEFLDAITIKKRTQYTTSAAEYKYVSKIIRYIWDNYQKKITVSDIAKTLFISPGYSRAVFKRLNGQTITQFLLEYRISRAKEFLSETNLKISEIATMCGFESQQYFTRVFNKHVGISPRQYMSSIKKDVF